MLMRIFIYIYFIFANNPFINSQGLSLENIGDLKKKAAESGISSKQIENLNLEKLDNFNEKANSDEINIINQIEDSAHSKVFFSLTNCDSTYSA